MKRIRLLKDIGYWGKTDKTYDVSDQRAKDLLRPRLMKDHNYVYTIEQDAELVKDLGRHIGRSKHTYDKNGASEAFGPGAPPKEVVSRREVLEEVVKQLNEGVRIYECKLCGYRNNPDIYGMEEIAGRWWHKFCLKRASFGTVKKIKKGDHKDIKLLPLFKNKVA